MSVNPTHEEITLENLLKRKERVDKEVADLSERLTEKKQLSASLTLVIKEMMGKGSNNALKELINALTGFSDAEAAPQGLTDFIRSTLKNKRKVRLHTQLILSIVVNSLGKKEFVYSGSNLKSNVQTILGRLVERNEILSFKVGSRRYYQWNPLNE